ncbi:MAG: glycosyltransferase [Lachnospiraceae bacterium]|nr:glycosyltransferase [Lachnospiraceae bacterium]
MIFVIVCDVLGKENNGTTIAAMNLIRHLRAKKYEVRVICPDPDRSGDEGYFVVSQFNAGPFNNYIRKNGVSLARPVHSVIQEALDRADAVHIMVPFILGRAVLKEAKRRKIPVTAGFHCQAENITSHLFLMNSRSVNNLAYKIMFRYFYNKVDAIHYPTEFIRNVFETICGTTNGYVISNGVNKAFRNKEISKPLEIKDKYIILFTGRYSKEKSHMILLKAVTLLQDKYDIQLIFAGSGPLERKLNKYAKKNLYVQPIMNFYSREELVRVINFSDLYVHPASVEIESISCIEAISCGTVPLISDSGRSAARSFALDERNLFHDNDPYDLSAKIEYWINNPKEAKICSDRYLACSFKYGLEQCMNCMEEMILNTINENQ